MNSMMGSTGMGMKEKIPKGMRKGVIQQFTPEQMKLFGQLFSNVGPESYTSRLAGGDQSLFEEMEAPAMRQFAQLQGENASRFSGMGMGARRGSGFQNYQNTATSNFAQDLQARRQELQRQAIKDLMGMSGDLLGQRPQANFLTNKQPKKKSFWESLLGAASPMAGAVIGGMTGGPMGASAGYQAGNAFGQAFQ